MIEKSLTTNDKHSAILREEGGDFTMTLLLKIRKIFY